MKTRICIVIAGIIFLLAGCGEKDINITDKSVAEEAENRNVIDGMTSVDQSEKQEGLSWQAQHFVLPNQYEKVIIKEDTIYGCYMDNGHLAVDYLDKNDCSVVKKISFSEASYTDNIEADKEGNLYVLGNNDETMWKVDVEGNFWKIDDFELEDTENAAHIIFKGLFTGDNGYVYIWYEMGLPLTEVVENGEDNVFGMVDRVYVKDEQFNTIFYEQVVNVHGTQTLRFQVSDLGNPLFVVQDREGIYIQKINVMRQKVEEKVFLLDNNMKEYSNITAVESGFLFLQGSRIYEYRYDTKQYNEILNLTSYGILPAHVIYLSGQEELIEIVDNYSEDRNSEYTVLKPGKAEKLVLSLGIMQASKDVEKSVAGFNRFNSDIQVDIVPYYKESEGFEAGLEQLKLDIIRGEAPDIIEVSMIDYEMFAEKGILADLFQYMQTDDQCKKDMLVSSVINAYELDGHLYDISPSFQLYSMWGSASIIDDRSGVTLEELIRILKSNGKDLNAIYGFSADESVLTTLCTFGMDEFINWENYTCNFESQYFRDVMEFAKEYKGGFQGSPSSGIRGEEILMTVGMISSVADYQIQTELYGQDVSFIGYPTAGGSGTAVSYRGSRLAINGQKDHCEEAWEFVKYYLMNGYDGEGFPMMKEQFDRYMQQAMKEDIIKTEQGTYEAAKGTYTDSDAYIEVFAATQKDVDEVKHIVEKAENKFVYHTEIQNIINEEAESYFTGQKELQEVTEIIQNRVELYLQEKK